MTDSCAVWPGPDATFEQAQAAKHELVCRKLGLAPGMRLLDVGCGWAGMLLHAARHHGVGPVCVMAGLWCIRRPSTVFPRRSPLQGPAHLRGRTKVTAAATDPPVRHRCGP